MEGNQPTTDNYEDTKEKPDPTKDATLYYFAGRGLADQIRWMLAATNVTFSQKIIDTRAQFLKLAEHQLPFGQLPLLQIDGMEIVQSQAAVRYLARRANMAGQTPAEQVKCEILAETIRDLISLTAGAPFQRIKAGADGVNKVLSDKLSNVGQRFEAILEANGGEYLVGSSMTYADILLAHMLTWYVEEVGAEVTAQMPRLVDLQNRVISLPSVRTFLESGEYYPVADARYCEQVNMVLGR